MSSIKLVYVAGPFSGENRMFVEASIHRAVCVGLEVARMGAMPVIPHSNTGHPEFERVQPYGFWIDGTMALLSRCDALITVPKWKGSIGATGEVQACEGFGIPVFHRLKDLAEWLKR